MVSSHFMNMSVSSVWRTALCLVAIVTASGVVHAQAVETQGCQITDTSCPCLEVQSEKLCMQHEGNNNCLLGTCKPSYRCDCLGYEMCKRASCALYTTNTDAIPSESELFGCHLTPDAGTCTKFEHVMDTTEAALNAYTEVDSANDEAMLVSMEAYTIVADIEADVIAVNDVLRTAEALRPYMSLEESVAIEKEAETVVELGVESGRLAGIASQNAAEVYKASREVLVLKNEAVAAENEAKKAEQQLKEKEEKAKKDGKECAECGALKAEFDRLEKTRREAAKKAGESAKNSREKRRKAVEHRRVVQGNRGKSQQAKARLVAVVEGVKKRASQ